MPGQSGTLCLGHNCIGIVISIFFYLIVKIVNSCKDCSEGQLHIEIAIAFAILINN